MSTHPRRVHLALALILALVTAMPASMAQRSPSQAGSDQTSAPRMRAVRDGSPFRAPAIDPRQAQRLSGGRAPARAAAPTPLPTPDELRAQLARLPGKPAGPKPDAPPLRAKPLSAPAPAASGAKLLAPQAVRPLTAPGCVEGLSNGELSDLDANGTFGPSGQDGGWWQDVPRVYVDPTNYTSASGGVYLLDGDEFSDTGVYSETFGVRGFDMFSHQIAGVTSSTTDISIRFRVRYQQIDPGYDYLYFAIGEIASESDGGNPLFGYFKDFMYLDLVPELPANEWHQIYVRITDPTVIAAIYATTAGQSSNPAPNPWFTIFSSGDNVQPYSDVTIDDISVEVCSSSSTLVGSVTQQGGGSSDGAQMLLQYTTPLDSVSASSGAEQFASTELFGPIDVLSESYSFSGLRALDTGATYQTYYVNSGDSSVGDGEQRIGYWVGPRRSTLGQGATASLSTFDISNVTLDSPTPNARAVVNSTTGATFSWGNRVNFGDTFYLCIYDTETYAESCSASPISGNSTTVSLADLQTITGFRYGREYAWYLIVVGFGGSLGAQNYGYSYNANPVSFIAVPPAGAGTPPGPQGSAPTGSSKDWTVMVYIAGDNNLGDVARYPNQSANLHGQFEALKQLAAQYPNINVVVQADFAGNADGTRYCNFRSDGTQACQQLGELDSSDPANLQAFLQKAIDNFPADRRMLVLSDHGHAVIGFGTDETTSATAVMSPNEIRSALTGAGVSVSNPSRKIDILFYNACLMGNFEVASDASAFADYMVASADLLWVVNYYSRIFPLLTTESTRTIAINMVTAYRQTVQATGRSLFITGAAYDLSRVAAVRGALNTLALALNDGLSDPNTADVVRGTLNRVRGDMQVYDSTGDTLLSATSDSFVDLVQMTDQIELGSGSAAAGLAGPAINNIVAAATALRSAVGPVGGPSSLVIASTLVSGGNGGSGTHSYRTGSAGISIFFPNGSSFTTGGQATLTNMYLNTGAFASFLAASQWDDFVALYTGVASSGAPTSGPSRVALGALPIPGDLPPLPIVSLPLIRR